MEHVFGEITLQRTLPPCLNIRNDAPSEILFKDLGIVPFKERVLRAKAILMFKAINSMLPGYVTAKFKQFRNVHSYNTRNCQHNLILPKVSQSYGLRTFNFSGAKLWNSLNADLKTCSSLNSFSRLVKQTHLS